MPQPHFIVKRADLVRELGLVSGAVERRTTIPILANVHIETTPDALVLTATDLEISLRSSLASQTKSLGAATISAKRLLDYVNLLPEGDVEVKFSDAYWASITAGRSKTRVAGIGPDSFPEIPRAAREPVNLPAAALAKQIKRASFAISQEESRFTLNGALLEISEERIRLVATDGHRMCVADSPGVPGVPQRLLVPRRAMVDLAKLTAGIESIGFCADDNHLWFTAGTRTLVARKLSGNFPEYARVMPKYEATPAVVATDDLKGAVARAKTMSDERSNAIRLRMEPGEVTISSSVIETGEAHESAAAEYAGDPIEIGLNAGYLLDFLAAVSAERVNIHLKDAGSAVQFSPAGEDGYKCVVMPMRI